MLDSLTQKQKIIFFIILLIMLIIIIYYIYSTLYSSEYTISYSNDIYIETNTLENNETNNLISENLETNLIIVYICGAVKENKVVKLKENSRIYEAIEAAGGLAENADLSTINLAYILSDGEKIYIPKIGEEINYESSNYSNSTNIISSSQNTKININKATQSELETIPGIGPSLALKIINYRENNGKFYSIEDIKNVSGIGEAKYEKIKNYISIK